MACQENLHSGLSPMASTIFLTGGSGFVGLTLIDHLTKRGHKVYALARSPRASAKVGDAGAESVLGDLSNLHEAQSVLKRCQVVVHSAAYMDFTYNYARFYEANVHGTENLVAAAKQADIKRFIYISAASVINGRPLHNVDERYQSSKLPQDDYSKTKAIAERLVLAANEPEFETVALRPPAIWGPNNPHYEDMLKMARQGNWLWIGGGNHVLSSIHVENLAAAVEAALQNGHSGQFYYVTDGEQRSLKSFFTAILRAEGIEPGDRSIPRRLALVSAYVIEFLWKLLRLKTRPPIAPVMVYLMGTEFSVVDRKARAELGYRNAISIDEGLRQMNASKTTV